ncbi:MAG: ABC transporter permease [Blastopirellula sp.]|nr:MAG: ABC transporter permease [Blastopirellula sp.]
MINNQSNLSPQKIAYVAYVAVILFFLELPVIVVVLASFSDTSYLTIPPQGLTLRWYDEVLSDARYMSAIYTSVKLALCATIISLVLGTAASYALIRKKVPFAATISSAIMAPLIFPAVVIGVALLQFYSLIGIRGHFLTLVLSHVAITVPYVVRSVMSTMAGTDFTIEEAARTLGADALTAFRLVTLPMIRPGLIAGGLFSFIISFDNVPVTIFLLNVREITLPVKIFTAIEHGVDPSIAAISSIMIFVTGAFLVFAERWIGFHKFA